MNYSENTIYIIGNSKSQQHNPITQLYGQFMIGFVIERDTGCIVEVGCNAIIPVTDRFIKDLFIGENIKSTYDSVWAKITDRYLGSSQKAILVAFKDAQKKYLDHLSGKPLEL
ncbi:MAG TPA: DUF3870 domain-containing protein [Clostridia bacterium]|nr:DUF3870 domain-containing protein [Clostridia bacterium]